MKIKLTKSMQDFLNDSSRRKRQFSFSSHTQIEPPLKPQPVIPLSPASQLNDSSQYFVVQSQDLGHLQQVYPGLVTQQIYTVPNNIPVETTTTKAKEIDLGDLINLAAQDALRARSIDWRFLSSLSNPTTHNPVINTSCSSTTVAASELTTQRRETKAPPVLAIRNAEKPSYITAVVKIEFRTEPSVAVASEEIRINRNDQYVPAEILSPEEMEKLKATVNIDVNDIERENNLCHTERSCGVCKSFDLEPLAEGTPRVCEHTTESAPEPTPGCSTKLCDEAPHPQACDVALPPLPHHHYCPPPLQAELSQADTVNVALETIQDDIRKLKFRNYCGISHTREGEPCSLVGAWTSVKAGVLFKILKESVSETPVAIEPTAGTPAGFITNDWSATVLMPFENINLMILTAINDKDLHMATFTGECRACEAKEFISGHWLIVRDERSCEEMNIASEYIGDIWERKSADVNFHTF